jgi:hypothetical protein
LHVKHLHGLHGKILSPRADGRYIVRIMEEGFEGHLVEFTEGQLVPATRALLKLAPSARLEWDYED